MSKRKYHECPTCRRHATVVGGRGVEIGTSTVTVGCCECGQLDDIVVARRIDGSSLSPDHDMPGGAMPRCRACGADAVVAWSAGDPCPRCGGPLS
jgi:hypothetical protein